jgi:ankyrin repeat protein
MTLQFSSLEDLLRIPIAQWESVSHSTCPDLPALVFATVREDEELVGRLLDGKVNPDAIESCTGWTALHHAADLNATTIVSMLLASGASLYARTKDKVMSRLSVLSGGMTPAHIAALSDNFQVAEQLLSIANAQDFTDARDNNGFTGLDIAKFCQHNEIASLFERFGGNHSLEYSRKKYSILNKHQFELALRSLVPQRIDPSRLYLDLVAAIEQVGQRNDELELICIA